MNVAEQTTVAEQNLSRTHDWNSKYNNRISVILTIDTGMLGVMAVLTKPSYFTSALGFAVLVTVILLGASFLLIVAGEYPRNRSSSPSLIYYGSVARMSENQLRDKFNALTPDDYLKDLVEQYWINSRILKWKFIILKATLILTVIAVIPWAVSLLIA